LGLLRCPSRVKKHDLLSFPELLLLLYLLLGALSCDAPRERQEAEPPQKQIPALDAALLEYNAQLLVHPKYLKWSGVELGKGWWFELALSNVGSKIAHLRGLEIQGDSAFQISRAASGFLRPGEVQLIRISFEPSRAGMQRGLLLIEAQAGLQLQVPLEGLGLEPPPCLPVEPPGVYFDEVHLGSSAKANLLIRNCEPQPMEILELRTEGNFQLEDLPRLPLRLSGTNDRQEAQGQFFQLRFTPEQLGLHSGLLRLESDRGPLEITLTGQGSPNLCPIALLVERRLRVSLGESIFLDGGASSDPEGQPLRYYWSILERPEGSRVPIWEDERLELDRVQSHKALLIPDRPGRFVLGLEVQDEQGNSSLDPGCGGLAQLQVGVSLPEEGLVVLLDWESPDDSDPLDQRGADLDLHLKGAEDGWFGASDCYHASPRSNPEADLMIFGLDGGGPELIKISPQGPGRYHLGVQAYRMMDLSSGQDYSPSFLRLRLYGEGRELWSGEGRLEAVNHLWEALEIQWPSLELRELNRYHERRP